MIKQPVLQSARDKLNRAYKLYVDLESDIKRYFDGKPYRIVRERDADTGDEILVYYPPETKPLWYLPIGDIIQNVRSSLDHAVYELTILENNGEALENTEFPIFEEKDKFFGNKKKGGDPERKSGLYKIRGLSKEAQDCIENLQSYNHRTDPEEKAYIEILRDLNNIDKHRQRLLYRTETRQISYENLNLNLLDGLQLFYNLNLDERTILLRWRFSYSEDSEMEFNPKIVHEIFLDYRNLPVFRNPEPVLKILYACLINVERILKKLEATIKA